MNLKINGTYTRITNINSGLQTFLLELKDNRVPHPITEPDWYKIDTLSDDDIVDVWDFAWDGHPSVSCQRTGFVNNMQWQWRKGSIGNNLGDGIYFNGSSALKLPTTGLDWSEVSVVIQLKGMTHVHTLDAVFSHFHSDPGSHYVYQNDFPDDDMRWTAGTHESGTVEVAGVVRDGVIGTS
jgi:hypothetical protein